MAIERAGRGHFVKGKSANPSGSVKLTDLQKADNLQALALIVGSRVEAVNYLIAVMRAASPKKNPKYGLIAAGHIIKGLESSKIELTGPDAGPVKLDVSRLSLAAKKEIADAYDKRNK